MVTESRLLRFLGKKIWSRSSNHQQYLQQKNVETCSVMESSDHGGQPVLKIGTAGKSLGVRSVNSPHMRR